ncbi:unnamed protein product [Arabis nemorensis]|uniref:F-box domain-containing protein n=1 Tax=Arabis nemorensis TaxID=586526 RepID=A0A565CH26_9BRAS|nr:unnamed protein product [Arabis nemorensis]
MAGGGNFFGRVFTYLANELIVNGLANSHAFQRFAVRTSKRIENISKMAAENKEKVAQHMEEISKNMDMCIEKLPVELLLRFRAVSKLWRREIESPRFEERQLRHQEKSRDPSILVGHPGLDNGGKATLRTLSLGATSVSLENHTHYPVHTKSELSALKITRSCDGLTCLYSNTFM